MEQLSLLVSGFEAALTPYNLLFLVIGAVLGTAVGVLPGLGSSMAVALLLPITFALDPTAAFIMFAAVYFGGLFGDSTAGILLNTPGQASAIASSLEGHKMALNGRAATALATAAVGAFIGGLISTTIVVFFSPYLVVLATKFGPAEYFALAVFAFVAISSVVSESIIRGLGALMIGVALSMVGIDGPSGTERFTLGISQLFDGVDIVVVTVGMLAIGEILHHIATKNTEKEREELSTGNARLSWGDFKRALPSFLRGTAAGAPFGMIPAGGSEVPTFLAYGNEKRLAAKRGDKEFGTTGSINGLAAPEAAGNATAGTALGTLMAIGLPTSATAAILLAAFQQFGLQPGPLLFERSGDLVWTLLASLFISLVVLLILNLTLAPVWAKLLRIPNNYLYAGIAVLATLGVYAVGASVVDLLIMLGLGVLGFLMRMYSMPLAPLLIGVILGPLAEVELRRALTISGGDPSALVNSPITIGIYVFLLGATAVSVIQHVRNIRKERSGRATVKT
ncbi:tripartite tricarboxylate transporter permease [Corynebacterium cystitidis]|uniref:Putative tricarboxylic transport membrane protein n=1 Tax=Corynebacterium cystitidis DSM 20524 TaxID=1121357 RepID=A0A1H9S859_9CORY|nr:tripartite tricarboxylate transporter permease [Corynebacterium cystitidis]WJY82252.1 Tripartite tricarboxylate transporter TctA family protein [Corynebacterium cystitidis DSM 20524]SER81192.1 putative tricarboxylic transport membrane protein [Corynebacterium cystitidis DSM 20524]SNV77265.1 citrate uptake transporter, membrane subunit [Corynebacterium cystitidis]